MKDHVVQAYFRMVAGMVIHVHNEESTVLDISLKGRLGINPLSGEASRQPSDFVYRRKECHLSAVTTEM